MALLYLIAGLIIAFLLFVLGIAYIHAKFRLFFNDIVIKFIIIAGTILSFLLICMFLSFIKEL